MKLDYHHSGLQFFFITITLIGRRKLLSRLIDEKHRPELLPFGELIKAALVAFHGAFPAATISDFVIMPDHVHFLLIANYAIDPRFNPLWATHRLIDAVEMAWNGRGQAPEPPLATLYAKAIAQARNYAANLHGRGSGAEQKAANLHGRGSGAPEQKAANLHGRGSGAPEPPSLPPLFDRSCYLELSFDSRQLKAIRRYIKLNPARALWKLRHPERFLRLTNLRYPTLDPARRWEGMGDPTLLASPFLYHVRLTLKKTVAEHAATIDELMEKARSGHIMVSGFISPGEKELLRRLKAEPRCRFIKMVPYALPPRYDPSAEDSRELAADRLLILSGFPEGVANLETGFRARCLAMNDMAARLCEAAQNRA